MSQRQPKRFRSGGTEADLRRVQRDAAYFGGMIGCGETYIPAFALALGLGETSAGLVASVPLLAGGAIQLLASPLVGWFGSFRRWTAAGAALQALTFLPLVWAAIQGNLSMPMLLGIASLYWAAGYSIGPAWNTWMEEIVPAKRRVLFFAQRSRVQQASTFVSLTAAGVLLHLCAASDGALPAFAVLFAMAGSLRMVSACYLYRTGIPSIRSKKKSKRRRTYRTMPRLRSIAATASVSSLSARRLITFLVFMQGFIQISGPYFAPYMLEQLQFGYATYVLLIAAAFISKVLSLSFWGSVADQIGVLKVLWIGGVGLVPLAFLWTVSANIYWLLLLQALGGVAWAAYELGFFLMFFESMPHNQRARLLTIYNFANTVAICVGAGIGAMVLSRFGCTPETYCWLFAISSMGRFVCLGILVGIVVPPHTIRSIKLRILSVRPGAGSVSAPIFASEERNPVPAEQNSSC